MTPATRAGIQAAVNGLRGIADALEKLLTPAPESSPDWAAFYAIVRKGKLFGGSLTQDQVNGCNRILAATEGMPTSWRAYVLATAYHETGQRMQPCEEGGRGRGKSYGRPGRNGGQVPYGRGDVQLTHDVNYERADRELSLNGALVADYNLALRPDISAKIIVAGMKAGWFTGKSLRHYLPEIATKEQFMAARRIVNGTDKAELIAGHALVFQAALLAAARPESLIS